MSVLDTSVVLAAVQAEPGGDLAAIMPSALLSSINLTEVATKLAKDGLSRSEVDEVVGALECEVVPFDRATAVEAGPAGPGNAPHRTVARGPKLSRTRRSARAARVHGGPRLGHARPRHRHPPYPLTRQGPRP
jgi:hypothetical protein